MVEEHRRPCSVCSVCVTEGRNVIMLLGLILCRAWRGWKSSISPNMLGNNEEIDTDVWQREIKTSSPLLRSSQSLAQLRRMTRKPRERCTPERGAHSHLPLSRGFFVCKRQPATVKHAVTSTVSWLPAMKNRFIFPTQQWDNWPFSRTGWVKWGREANSNEVHVL